MSETRTPRELFAEAATLVEAAVAQLNSRYARCKCCGLDVYENRLQGSLAKQFDETGDKLRRAAAKLGERPRSQRAARGETSDV